MPDITLQPMPVLVDGGSHDGRLVLADGSLVAVFARVSSAETAGGEGRPGDWFLEAGFGPCGDLMSVRPPVFATLDEAVDWVRATLATGRLSS
jgi:hypothetical protein